MGSREPLAGWCEFPDGGAALPGPIGMTVAAGFGDASWWTFTVTIHRQGDSERPRIAAEDAARAGTTQPSLPIESGKRGTTTRLSSPWTRCWRTVACDGNRNTPSDLARCRLGLGQAATRARWTPAMPSLRWPMPQGAAYIL